MSDRNPWTDVAERGIQYDSELARLAAEGITRRFEQYTRQCAADLGVCPDPPAHRVTEHVHRLPPSDGWMLGVAAGGMLGALLGWLAPALVTLAVIAVVTFSYYHPPRWLHDPLARYSPVVRAMVRRW